jgi:hypothetical protein
VPAVAGVADTSEPDAIFALIDAAKLAQARFLKVLEELNNKLEELSHSGELDAQRRTNLELSLAEVREKERQCCGASSDADNAVLDAKPRTLVGLASPLIFAAECYLFNEKDEYFLPLLVNAARMIDGPLVSKIGLSEQLAEILSDDEDQEA